MLLLLEPAACHERAHAAPGSAHQPAQRLAKDRKTGAGPRPDGCAHRWRWRRRPGRAGCLDRSSRRARRGGAPQSWPCSRKSSAARLGRALRCWVASNFFWQLHASPRTHAPWQRPCWHIRAHATALPVAFARAAGRTSAAPQPEPRHGDAASSGEVDQIGGGGGDWLSRTGEGGSRGQRGLPRVLRDPARCRGWSKRRRWRP